MRKIKKDDLIYFECEECGFLYRKEKWAEKCEVWCSKNKTCNLGITKHSVKKVE